MASSTREAFLRLMLGACLAAHGVARAQDVCGLETRVPFAGHTFPLDSVPEPQPMTVVPAFPGLLPNTFLEKALFLTAPPDGTDRLFVVEREGRIRVFENDPLVDSSTLFLEVSERVLRGDTAQGLLGLAFDPDYASNGYFYVNYTASAADCAVAASSCTKMRIGSRSALSRVR